MDHSSYYSGQTPSSANSMEHGMPGMNHDDMCSMNMLFTWDWKNTCLVFKWWHIRTLPGFISSVLAVILFTAGYELVKSWVTRWQLGYVNVLSGASASSSEVAIRRYKVKRSLFYGLQVGYSFFLMLVFMTYNGWLMIAVVVGATLGNYLWGSSSPDSNVTRDMSCH